MSADDEIKRNRPGLGSAQAPERMVTAAEAFPLRKINPVGMRVLVKIERETDTTASGLYLPEGAKSAMAESVLATVTEVASASDHHTDIETNISGIPLGAKVLIRKDAGIRIPWDEDLRIVESKEVLAVVDEVGIT